MYALLYELKCRTTRTYVTSYAITCDMVHEGAFSADGTFSQLELDWIGSNYYFIYAALNIIIFSNNDIVVIHYYVNC